MIWTLYSFVGADLGFLTVSIVVFMLILIRLFKGFDIFIIVLLISNPRLHPSPNVITVNFFMTSVIIIIYNYHYISRNFWLRKLK